METGTNSPSWFLLELLWLFIQLFNNDLLSAMCDTIPGSGDRAMNKIYKNLSQNIHSDGGNKTLNAIRKYLVCHIKCAMRKIKQECEQGEIK